ncbi:hypothetical protein [Streptomyces canus]|uniref:hypothetical protein n=1 Tax=Streptomyces canus TaxID=58343 RepID=UPI0036F03B74
MGRELGATGPGGAGDEPAISRFELYRCARALREAAREAGRFQDGDPDVFVAKVDAIAPALRRLVELVTGEPSEELPITPARSGMGRQDAQETVRRSIELAEDLLARDFTDETLREAFGVPRPTVDETPVFGERMVAVLIDISSYVVLDFTDSEAVARKALSEATRNSTSGTKMAVSALQYTLGVSPLRLFDDTTKLLGEAVRKHNDEALKANVAWLADVREGERRLADLLDWIDPEPPDAPDGPVGPVGPDSQLASASEVPDNPGTAKLDVLRDDDGTRVEHPGPEERPTLGTVRRHNVEFPGGRGFPGL